MLLGIPNGTKLIDWKAGLDLRIGSDITSLLIDLHKSGYNISNYYKEINLDHCLTLMGFWLNHATWAISRRRHFLS